MHNILKSKKTKIIALMGTLLGASTVSLILSCVAWFSEVDVFKPYDVYSSVITSYFDSGSGTETDPYIITRPIHYWNLVYLQESNLEGFADGHLYFQLGKDMDRDGYAEFYEYDDNGVLQWVDDSETQERYSKYLNMNYYQSDKAILPLGSSIHPFTGHINGNNLTVKNLYINGDGRADIGVFGYCDQKATVDNTYFYNVNIDIKNPNPESNPTQHSPSHTTTANIGYLCGHIYDADSQFNNVYINECEMYNSEAASGNYDILNTYSYFGRVDVVNRTDAATASYRSDLNPTLVHNYLDTNYDSLSGKGLKSRNTEYVNNVSSNKFSDAVSQNTTDDSYSMNSNFKGDYDASLSTVGYTSGDTVVKNIRYKDGEDFNRLSTTTTELDHEPTNNDEDGKYVYWDSTNTRWKYAVVSSTSGEEQTIQFNCFYISFTISNTKYYLYYDDSSTTSSPTLSVTSTAPGDSSNEDDYYFVFKELENSKGVATLKSSDEQTGYYIYSPANQKYLTQKTYEGSLLFTDAFKDALTFNIKGPETSISLKINSHDEALLASSSGIEAKHTSGTTDPTIFDIGNVEEDKDSTTATYDLLTDASVLTDGSVIAIGTGYTGDIYVMSTVQNGNNRSTTNATVTNNYISNVPNLCEIELKQNTNGWAFYDKTYNNNEGGYLYAAGKKSSGNNYLRTETTLDSNNYGLWTISINSSTYTASIQNVGNAYTPYMLFNNGNNGDKYKLFACYDKTTKGEMPYIFLRNEASTIAAYISHSVVRSYTSTISTDEKNILIYDTYVGALNTTTYTELFTVKRTDSESIIFNFSNSTVSYKATLADGWIKVTSISSLTAGDTIAIVASNYDYALSTKQNSDNRGAVSITKSDNQITFDSTTDPTVAQLTLGGSSGSWTFYDSTYSGYLYAASSSDHKLKTRETNSDENGIWSITISSTGTATITAQGDNTHKLLKYNAASTLFSCYTNGMQDVCIYKYFHTEYSDANYIADEIGGYYNPDIMDVVGKADFYNNYVQIPGASTADTTKGIANKVGSKFYATQYTDNALVVYVENSGSRDLGTLTVTYSLPSGSDAYPELIQSRSTGYAKARSSFTDNGCYDLDDDASTTTYMLNININNIGKLCFCALDADGNVYATYDDNGDVVKCKDETYSVSSVDRYVLYIGVNPGTNNGAININSARFEFTQAPGNIGEFGTVGYRSAVYNDDGSLNEAESRVSGTVLNFYYLISIAGAKVTAKTYFDHTTHTYEITFTSNVSCTIYVFNYDSNTYTVKINGQTCTHGTNVISITAS